MRIGFSQWFLIPYYMSTQERALLTWANELKISNQKLWLNIFLIDVRITNKEPL